MKPISMFTTALVAVALTAGTAGAQHSHAGPGAHNHPDLNVNTRWKECSIQLSASLTPDAWRQFTREAGMVVYFRPLSDARPMGRGRFEVSALRWETGIDDADAAWNDTFVHPDSAHVLFDGSRLAFPGLMVRAGVGDRTDVGVYVTKSPGANYGFAGAQVQRSLVETPSGWAAAARGSFVTLYGPEDVGFTVYGADLVASRTVALTRRMTLSPYAGVSAHLSTASERSAVVALGDERVLGGQATVGAALQLSAARLGVEYNVATVHSLSFKVGFGR